MDILRTRRRSTPILLSSALAALGCMPRTAQATLPANQWVGGTGAASWNVAGNWHNGNVPASTEDAIIYAGDITLYANAPTAGELLLSDVGGLGYINTNNFNLHILDDAALDGGQLIVANAPSGSLSFQAGSLAMTDSAFLYMDNSTSHIRISNNSSGTPNGGVTLDGTSAMYVAGTFDAGSIQNAGAIYAGTGGVINTTNFNMAGSSTVTALLEAGPQLLTINATNFELHDPNTQINLNTSGNSLSLQGTPDLSSGYIGSTVLVGPGSTLTLGGGGDSWVFGYYSKSGSTFISHGNVYLNGGTSTSTEATISGYAAYLANVTVTGTANIPSGEFDGGSNVSIASGGRLYLNGPYLQGLSNSPSITFSGAGTLDMNGNMLIGQPDSSLPYTTVNVNAGTIFDWDGDSNAGTCTINNGELDIYTTTIDVQAFFHGIALTTYGYHGALTVNADSTLNVANTPWTLYGPMTLGPGAIVQGGTLTLDGSALPAGTNSLTPSYAGTNFPVIQAPVVVNPNTTIYMGFNGGLHLDGATNWAGGTVTSAPFVSGSDPYGILVQDGNATVSANTTIFCGTLDMDGTANTATWTINPGVTLTQEAFHLDTNTSTANAFHSTLNLNGGTLSMQTFAGSWTLAGGTINMTQIGANLPAVEHDTLTLGSGSSIGTINVAANTEALVQYLYSGTTSVAGGNILNVGSASILYLTQLGSLTNAVLTKTGPGIVAVEQAQSHSTGSQLIVNQGELDLYTDAGTTGANLTLNASGGLTHFAVSQHLNNLIISTGATVAVTAASPKAVVVSPLNISGGTLDLQTNDMIAKSGNVTTLFQNLASGFNYGAWTGAGITSTSAAADTTHLHAVGMLLNKSATNTPIYSTFDSQSSVTTDVLLKYTYYGDADLNGKVDASDYSRIDSGYVTHATGWSNGDFNYDGVINGSDYTLIDNAFNRQGAVISTELATPTAELAPTTTAVPEPASLLLTAIGGFGALRRRPQRHSRFG